MTRQEELAHIRQSAIALLKSDWATGIEMLVTATEIERLFAAPSDANTIATFLAKRFERIRGTDLSYIHATHLPITRLCLQLATDISPSLGKPALQLLMPTLKNNNDPITLCNLDDWQLSDILLRDNDTDAIDIVAAIDKMSAYDLTPTEAQRLIQHSAETRSVHDANEEIQQFDISDTIGAAIEALLIPRLNHASIDGERDGIELIAGLDADIGLIQFNALLESLPADEYHALFQCRVSPTSEIRFKDLWERLTYRDFTEQNDAVFIKGTRDLARKFCIRDIRIDLQFLLDNNPQLFQKKSANVPVFLATLKHNKIVAICQLRKRVATPSIPVNSSYGCAGKRKLICNVLSDNLLNTLTITEKNSIQQVFRALLKKDLKYAIQAVPETHRYAFFKLIGVDYIQQVFIECGYSLSGCLQLLPKIDRGNFLFSINYTALQEKMQSPYEWGQVLMDLDEVDAIRWVTTFTPNTLQHIFRSGLDIKNLLAVKLTTLHWPKVAALFQTEILHKALYDFLTREFHHIAPALHLPIIQFLGINRVLAFFPETDKRKKFLSQLSHADQETLWSQADYQALCLTMKTTSKKNLNATIKQQLEEIDALHASKETKQRFYKDTLCFYKAERLKHLSPYSFFSGKKTSAIEALQKADSAKSPSLSPYQKQLKRENTLGQIYRRIQ